MGMVYQVVGDDGAAFQDGNPGGVIETGKFQLPLHHHLVKPAGFVVPSHIRQGGTEFIRCPVGFMIHFVEKAEITFGGLHKDVKNLFIHLPGVMARNEKALGLTYRREEILLLLQFVLNGFIGGYVVHIAGDPHHRSCFI